MPRAHYLQSSFTAGVLDPRLSSRTDIGQYFQGMSVGTNVVTVPLGGVKRRPGLQYITYLPNTLSAIDAGTETAPNGGTAGNASDDDRSTVVLTTANLSTTNPYVVVHYDLGSAQDVMFADVLDMTITAGTATNDFVIQYSTDNSVWVNFDTAGTAAFQTVDQTARDFRRGEPGTTVSARYWRVAKVTGDDLSTAKAQLSEFRIWGDSGTNSAVAIKEFEFSETDQYVICFTDKCITIVNNGALYLTVPTEYASADIAEIDAAQSGELMVIVHEDYAPASLSRETANVFNLDDITFTNIPQYDYADSSSPSPTSEIQDVAFTTFAEGDTFQLELEGSRSAAIPYSADTTTTANNIAREVQKLYTVGFTGVSCAHQSGTTYRVTFANESAAAYDLMVGTTLSGSGTIAVTQNQNGSPRREDVWSSTRGYPRTVTFHEGRLWFGGLKSIEQAYLGSVVNSFFDFETGEGLDDDAIFGVMNTENLNAVTGIKSGRFPRPPVPWTGPWPSATSRPGPHAGRTPCPAASCPGPTWPAPLRRAGQKSE